MCSGIWNFLLATWPALIGIYVGAFVWGHETARRKGAIALKRALEERSQLHDEHIANIEAAFGIDASRVPAKVYVNWRPIQR